MSPEKQPTAEQPCRFAAVIPAAGTGQRMGGCKKPHIELCGRPILDYSIEAFYRLEHCVQIVPVLHREVCVEGREPQRLRSQYGIDRCANGGPTRQASAFSGLQMVAPDIDIVLIHDAARPLVSPNLIISVAQATERWGGAVAAVPAVHTVKEVDGGRITGTLPRSRLWFAHTPQGFDTNLILRAHRAAREEGFTGTDDAQLVERLGGEVHVVREGGHNLKITTPEDLAVAEAILAWRASSAD